MTAEAAGQVPPGEAGFQLLADELPDVIIVAFDPQLMMWAATGGGLRGHGWTAEDFVGRELPRIAGSSQAGAVEACARAALGGLCTELEMNGYEDTRRLWSITFVPLADAAGVVSGGMALCRDITEQRRAEELLRARQHQLAVAQRIARGRRAALAGHQGPVGRGDQPAPDHRPAASPGAGRGRPGGRPA